MRVAIVHDWLVGYAGAERVLEQILNCYPDADLFSLVDFLQENERGFINGKKATTSFIQKLPFAENHFRNYLAWFPIAIQQLDLSSYDLVLSSSFCVAKGVVTGPNQKHICYCHSPVRYAWDRQHEYLAERGLDKGLMSPIVRKILHNLRQWDGASANGVDEFVSNSQFISRRIEKAYRRESTVIYPPVATDDFTLEEKKSDFYVTASRQVPYKRIPLIVEAFRRMPERKLVVIGDGPDADLVRKAAGSAQNITIMGHQSFEVLKDHMGRAKAFVFAALEDFGIVPVEAQACGTPVIAYGKGGAAETIKGLDASAPTGVLFYEQSIDSIVAAVETFEENNSKITAQNCRENALRFGEERFRKEFVSFVEESMS